MALKGILTLAVIVGIVYGGIKGCSQVDRFMKTHKSYSRVAPACGFYNISECNHQRDIDEYEQSLEKIPDQIQDIVNDYHGRVYFYELDDKYMTAVASQDIVKHGGFYSPWDLIRGIEKGMFVSCRNEDKEISNTALHEYGHAIDDFLGQEFFGKKISETAEMERMCEQYKPKLGAYYHTPIEFFAEMTEEYYRTKQSRKYMKNEFPEMFRFYKELEEQAVKRGVTSERNFVTEAAFDLFMVKTGIAPRIMKWLD